MSSESMPTSESVPTEAPSALTLQLTPEYGYVLAVAVAMFLLQQVVMIIPVIRQRLKTGIAAPTLYPRDQEIKTLKLNEKQVKAYMCAQRAHQNNVEFTSVFMPLFLATGLFPAITLEVAMAGAWVVVFRFLGAVGYLFGVRQIGAFYSFGSFYIVYLACKQAYALAHPVLPAHPAAFLALCSEHAELVKSHALKLPEHFAAARATAGF